MGYEVFFTSAKDTKVYSQSV